MWNVVNSDSHFLRSSPARIFMENKIAVQRQRISRNFIETRSSEELDTGPKTEPDESSPHSQI